MCDPVSITMAAVQTAGQIKQGRDAKKAADAQASLDEQQAAEARASAEGEARRIRRAGGAARGETLAAVAASGIKIGEGSALDAERQVMTDYETDAAMALLTGDRQSGSLMEQARQRRRAGRDARNASLINAGTSLMSSGSKWVGAKQAPAPVETRDISFSGYGGRN